MNAPAGTRLHAARREAAARLAALGKPDAALEARRLVAHVLDLDPARLSIEPDRPLAAEEIRRLDAALAERADGRSVGRIVGWRRFHDIRLAVRDDVLEPRDDTGALVELALSLLRAACERRGEALLHDIGTGSGAVALALLAAEPRARAVASDVSDAALASAAANAERLGLSERIAFERADALASTIRGRFDLVVSNPPYVPSDEIATLAPEVRRDPVAALDGGTDGLDVYRRFATSLSGSLRPEGALALEIGAGQGPALRAIFARAGWSEIASRRDLGGTERAIAFRR